MAAIKLTTSGKAIQFIDDEGRVYQTSLYDYSLLVAGKKKFTTPVRLPHDVSPQRFPPSKLLMPDPNGGWKTIDVPRGHKMGGHDAYDLKKAGDNSKKNTLKERKEW